MKYLFLLFLQCFLYTGISAHCHVSYTEKDVVGEVSDGTSQKILSWEKSEDALRVETSGGTLFIQPYRTGSLHIMYGNRHNMQFSGSYAVPECPETAAFKVKEKADRLQLFTEDFSVSVDKAQGYITLSDGKGKTLIRELPGKARLNAIEDKVRPFCKFQPDPDEALYGLGQFRDGRLNLRNAKRELVQFNTQAAVPVIYSTKGWGLFWNNPSRTLYSDNSSGMTFESDYGDVVDYYLFIGNSLDELVASYRNLTGRAPMYADWALGYHQSRNKYSTQQEVLGIAEKMKERNLKMSTIFVDYYYWKKYGTGSHRFDETLFPDVPDMIDRLHKTYDTRLIITMWPAFKPGTENYKKLKQAGYLLEGARALDGSIYDAFNPKAREMYWNMVLPLVHLGVDGWFLDGPEPDNPPSFLTQTTFAGPAVKVRNLYPLVHAESFYNGLLKERPGVRPYILTRCAWAAQQRAGTAVWSGDIPVTFTELRKQIAAGLNFTATGIPYWTTDIGGYAGGNPADENYREVFARWFEYGTFCPVFRAHGRRYPGNRRTSNEPWAYGEKVEEICRDFIDLRYRLLPYVYSLSGQVTWKHYTPMRLLAFDFSQDSKVLDCRDQFMYGPAFLVCPVTESGARNRKVYLPAQTGWVDFWSGKRYEGGKEYVVEAPLERIPLFVKEGSVIPMYKDPLKNIDDSEPLDIHVYAGADGMFELYEDDGATMDYMEGVYNITRFDWNNSSRTLTISPVHESSGSIRSRKLMIHLHEENGNIIKQESDNAFAGGKIRFHK